MKKNILIGILSILLVAVFIMQINTSKALREKQERIDTLFKRSMEEVSDCLLLDYNHVSKEMKWYYYSELKSAVDRAWQLLRQTSYYKTNDKLEETIKNLNYYFAGEILSAIEVDLETNKKIYMYLTNLHKDYNSKEKNDELLEYLESIK